MYVVLHRDDGLMLESEYNVCSAQTFTEYQNVETNALGKNSRDKSLHMRRKHKIGIMKVEMTPLSRFHVWLLSEIFFCRANYFNPIVKYSMNYVLHYYMYTRVTFNLHSYIYKGIFSKLMS